MRKLAFLVAVAGALCASGAMAQTTVQPAPTAAPINSPPQTPATASPEAPMFGPSKFGPVSVVYNIGVGSEYVFRGVSQTDESIALSGGVDFTYKAFYLGTWASNVDFRPFGDRGTNTEIDLYGGFKTEFAGFALDLGGIYYGYAGQPTGGPSVDYYEGYIKATKAFGPLTVGGSFFYSPDFTGETGDAEYYEGNFAYAFNKKLSFSGAVARQEIEKAASYTTWNIGASYLLTDNLSLDLRYYDTDEHGFGDQYGSRGVAAIKLAF